MAKGRFYDKVASTPKSKKPEIVEESDLIKAVKNADFIKFLEKQPRYADFMDRLPADPALQADVIKLFKVWEKSSEVIKELKQFYGSTFARETGIKLNGDDLKAIEIYINEFAAEPDNSEKVLEWFENFKKFQKFPEEISQKQVELVALSETVSAEIKKAQDAEASKTDFQKNFENSLKSPENTENQINVWKRRLERRKEIGFLSKKRLPLVGMFFRDREDNLALSKSAKKWQEEIETLRNLAAEQRSSLASPIEAAPVIAARKKILTGKEKIEEFRSQYQNLRKFFLSEFPLVEIVANIARLKMQQNLNSILKDENNAVLDNAQKDFEKLIDEKSGELFDGVLGGLQADNLKNLDDAISARFYADCKRVMRSFAWNKDSNKGKLKELLQKFMTKESLGSKSHDAVTDITAEALVETLLDSRDYNKKKILKELAVDLGINLEQSLSAAIDRSTDDKKRERLMNLLAEMSKVTREKTDRDVSPEDIGNRIIKIKEHAEQFLAGLENVHSFEELISYVKSQPIKSLHFDNAVYFEKYLLEIIEDAKKTRKLDKFNSAPSALQAKIKELLNPKTKSKEPAPTKVAEEKDKNAEPVKPAAEPVKTETPESQAPVSPVEPEVVESKAEEKAKPEIVQTEITPENLESKILPEDDVYDLLAKQIGIIRTSANEISAKMAIAEADKLVRRYLDNLKANRVITKADYKKLKKQIEEEFKKLKNATQNDFADKFEQINKQFKNIESGDLPENKKPEVQASELVTVGAEWSPDPVSETEIAAQPEIIKEEIKPEVKAEPETEPEAEPEIINETAPEEQAEPELSLEEQAQEIIDGIDSSQEVDEIISYLETVPRFVDAENRVLTGFDVVAKINRAAMNIGEIDNMSEEDLPSTYGLRAKLKELFGI